MTSIRNSFKALKGLARTLKQAKASHKERHQPSGHDIAISDRIGLLNQGLWDSCVAGRSIFLSRQVLKVIESHPPEGLTPRYAIISKDGCPVAAVAAQLISIQGNQIRLPDAREKANLARRLVSKTVRPVAEQARQKLRERLVVAGNLLSWGPHGVAFSAGVEPEAVWPAVAEALYRIRRADRLSGQADFTMVKDFEQSVVGGESLSRFGYRQVETEPNMVLELRPEWKSYEDYLGALDSKYRKNSRDQMKKLCSSGCILEQAETISSIGERLHELYASVQQNAAVRLITVPAGYLNALANSLGENFRCNIVRHENDILGFVTTLRDGDTAIGYFIGFDRDAAASGLPIYLRLLHSTIGNAIEWGCKRLSLGRTALEPKAALGAKPEKMTVWVRHRIPAVNYLLGGLLGAIPHAEVPARNPFKATTRGEQT